MPEHRMHIRHELQYLGDLRYHPQRIDLMILGGFKKEIMAVLQLETYSGSLVKKVSLSEDLAGESRGSCRGMLSSEMIVAAQYAPLP